jgi:serine/threonine-protein kinase
MREPLVLPADVSITAAADIPAPLRRELGVTPDTFAVARAGARIQAKIVDRDGTTLLTMFRQPQTILDAVIAFSREHGDDPRTVLTDAFPLLAECVHVGLLVPADSPRAHPIAPLLLPGDALGRWRVVRTVHLMIDTEVHEVIGAAREPAALKLVRPAGGDAAVRILENEIRCLRVLGGAGAPLIIEEGTAAPGRYVVTSWEAGRSPQRSVARWRGEAGGARRTLDLATRLVRRYAALHAAGVLHGDVHPGNIRVAPDGSVTLLDFGLGQLIGPASAAEGPRGGAAPYQDPESAAAILDGSALPPPTALGEQYSVAAVVFELIAGRSYLRPSAEQEEMLAQIVGGRPSSFEECGAEPWPELEAVIARALEKDPSRRYPSMRAFAEALARVRVHVRPRRVAIGEISRFVESTVAELRIGGRVFCEGLTVAPTGSLNFGASGIAYGLCRIACARDDADLLASADAWSTRALRAIGQPEAYASDDGIDETLVGRASLFHSPPGTYFAQVVIAHALGDSRGVARSTAAFVRAARVDASRLDVAAGCSGILLACVSLRALARRRAAAGPDRLSEYARDVHEMLCGAVGAAPAIGECSTLGNLGVAHGWAGILYAMLCARPAGHGTPELVAGRLGELAALAERRGKGARWRWYAQRSGEPGAYAYMPGWCNGSAGFVHVWCAAYRELGEPEFLELAERAAWTTWASAGDSADLCCGLAGRAYALLRVHRVSADRIWLDRAHRLAARAVRAFARTRSEIAARYRWSLWRGAMGIATLIAELEQPQDARMPIFEGEA